MTEWLGRARASLRVMRRPGVVLCAACGLFLATGTEPASGLLHAADVIELKTGQKLEGEVLKEKAGELFIDVGVDVVRIPLSAIKSRQASDRGPGPKTFTPKVDKEKTDVDGIFSTAELPVRSIKELAQRFGEGVVLVQTPGGLGSGFIINSRGYCVTNYHVVERETRIAATIFHRSASGEFVRRRIDDVKIIALNPFLDLALLQIPVQKDTELCTWQSRPKSEPIPPPCCLITEECLQ